MSKKTVIALAIIVLALLIGFFASRIMGPPERTDLPVETSEERAQRLGLDDAAGTNTDDAEVLETAPARDVTGNEGETIDGVRQLAPAEPTRPENRDYFEGLEDMDAAVPVSGTSKPAFDSASKAADAAEKAGDAAQNAAQEAAKLADKAAKAAPKVERPDADLMDAIDGL